MPAGDTCTYVSGNWVVTCSDNCIQSSDMNIGENNLTLNGNTGIFTLNANLNVNRLDIAYGCEAAIQYGKELRMKEAE